MRNNKIKPCRSVVYEYQNTRSMRTSEQFIEISYRYSDEGPVNSYLNLQCKHSKFSEI